MRWTPVEINLIGALEAVADEEPPLCLVGPPEADTEDAICLLLVREARGYHKTERDVVRRRLTDLEERIQRLTEGVERDRAGEPVGAISLPGHQQALDRRERLTEQLEAHEQALVRLHSDACPSRLRELLSHFEIHPRGKLERLKQDGRDRGQIIELFTDGYGMVDVLSEALTARRVSLGLTKDHDWE